MYDIWIYCGGKCGGSTLVTSFNKSGYESIHTHDFNYMINTLKIPNAHAIFKKSCSHYHNVYIIDVYRTPIERKISSFFQNIKNHLPNYKKLSIQELIDFFNNKLLNFIEEYHSIDDMLNYNNVPLFTTFDFKNKYNIVKKDNIVFIKLLFKDIDEWSIILSNIFNKNIEICNTNLTDTKEIFSLYNEFKKQYKVPINYIENKLINNNEFKIYNTVSEQSEYINKWKLKSYK
jgi:hypothetical protein